MKVFVNSYCSKVKNWQEVVLDHSVTGGLGINLALK